MCLNVQTQTEYCESFQGTPLNLILTNWW